MPIETPREPDRYEARAAKIIGWVAGVPGYLAIHKVLLPVIADCLRSAEASALERAAQEVERVDPRETITREEARVITRRAKAIRALASPEAPPAKEPCRAEVASRFPEYTHYECELPGGHVGPHSEGGTEWTDATTVVAPPSEPVAPAPSELPIDAGRKMVAEAKAVSALGESLLRAEKRIAELEELLRECEEVLRAAKQADNAWFSGAIYNQLDRVIRKLAARTASPGKGEG